MSRPFSFLWWRAHIADFAALWPGTRFGVELGATTTADCVIDGLHYTSLRRSGDDDSRYIGKGMCLAIGQDSMSPDSYRNDDVSSVLAVVPSEVLRISVTVKVCFHPGLNMQMSNYRL